MAIFGWVSNALARVNAKTKTDSKKFIFFFVFPFSDSPLYQNWTTCTLLILKNLSEIYLVAQYNRSESLVVPDIRNQNINAAQAQIFEKGEKKSNDR